MNRKILSIILIAIFILPSVPASAAANSRATFENTKNAAPNLYITKEVVSADANYPAPTDAAFEFVLKIDDQLAESVEYRVFGKDGDEIFDKDLLGNRKPFITSRSGNFTLKADQTALFEYVGAGKSYEITELNIPDRFQQTIPAGGVPAKGTVTGEGVNELFVNTYYPPSIGEKYTTLEISKDIIFPQGYTAPTSPAFNITVNLDGSLYANERFNIFDAVTNVRTKEGLTSSRGAFALNAGEVARFENVPVGADYEITEADTKDWYVIGTATRKGATIAPLTSVSYTNRSASFGVSKKLDDNTVSDDEFTFVVSDGDRVVVEGLNYYLYGTDGHRIDDKVYKTDADGQFVLKPNQAAIFFGVPKGMVYNVSELATPDYVQLVPTGNEGYKDKIVDDSFEMLPFVNEKQDIARALTVTKVVSPSDAGETPVANDDFTFILSKRDSSGTYNPLPNEFYSVRMGGSTLTHQTDAEGKFTLKRNQTAVFERVEVDEFYKVEEVDLTADYTCETTSYEGKLADTELAFTFDNKFKGKGIDLFIHKTNNAKEPKPLSGAAFNLYTDEAMINPVNTTPLVSGADGKIAFIDIKSGIYYLQEIESPPGYQLLTNAIKIEITRDNDDLKVKINDEDSDDISIVDIVTGGSRDEITLRVTNHIGFNIPKAGGIGIHWYIIVALIGLTATTLVLRRRGKLSKQS